MKLYGIPNCSTVKKARVWLDDHAADITFHDFRKQGVDAIWLRKVIAQTGWQALVNTRGTTWRQLTDTEKAAVIDDASAIALMQAHPGLIKRPILERNGTYHLGFTEAHYQSIFGG